MKTLVFLFLVACNGCNPQPTPVQPRVFGDDASDACVQACAKLAAWACPEALPTPSGETCESFCMRTSSMLDPRCVADAQSPSDLPKCEVRCAK